MSKPETAAAAPPAHGSCAACAFFVGPLARSAEVAAQAASRGLDLQSGWCHFNPTPVQKRQHDWCGRYRAAAP